MRPAAPWTDTGALQAGIQSLKQQVSRKAEAHEIHEINRKLDGLERSIREVRAENDGFRTQFDTLREILFEVCPDYAHRL